MVMHGSTAHCSTVFPTPISLAPAIVSTAEVCTINEVPTVRASCSISCCAPPPLASPITREWHCAAAFTVTEYEPVLFTMTSSLTPGAEAVATPFLSHLVESLKFTLIGDLH